MKNHTVQARLNELEYLHLEILKDLRNKMQEEEGITYSNSDIIRIALSYMYSIEWTGSRKVTVDKEIMEMEQLHAKEFWEKQRQQKD